MDCLSKVRGTKVPEKSFFVKGMTGKFTEGSWKFFHIYRLIPPADPADAKKSLTLIPRFHIHQTVGNGRAGDLFFGNRRFFRQIFIPGDLLSGDSIGELFFEGPLFGDLFSGDFFSRIPCLNTSMNELKILSMFDALMCFYKQSDAQLSKILKSKISLSVYSRKLPVAADFKHFILFLVLVVELIPRLFIKVNQ